MIKSYMLIAWRSIARNKINSIITVAGLAVGIACCLLISLYVKEEWTFDQFHSKANRIYRVWAMEDWGENQQFSYSTTPYPMGPTLKENFEEVIDEVRINPITSLVRINEEQYTESITVAGQSFFNVFDFQLLSSTGKKPLGPQSIVITERTARKYFGDANPIDKIIQVQLTDNFEDFVVSGVVKNPPTNSSIQFDILIADTNFKKFVSDRVLTSAWFNISPETYVLLSEKANAQKLASKFPSLFKTLLGDDFAKSKYKVMLQPIADIHLNNNVPAGLAPVSDPKYSYILLAAACLILLMACINFISISIGRSLKRSREVGIRKVVGARKQQLITQFVGEAILITIISMILGLILSILLLPLFNNLSQKQLAIEPGWFLLIVSMCIVFVVGVLSGSYPAFILSNLKVFSIFKGYTECGGSKHALRRALVSIQITLGVLLVTSTLIMKKQLQFLQDKNLGFDREQLVVVQLNVTRGNRLIDRVNNGFEMVRLFENEMEKLPAVAGVCGSSHDFANGAWVNVGYTDDKGVYRTFNLNIVDANYFDVLGMKSVSGRFFDKTSNVDVHNSVVVNEAFVAEMGWDDPIGKRLPGKNFGNHEIIGVVSDFNYASLHTKVQPLVIVMDPAIILPGIENIDIDNSPIPKLFVRLQAGSVTQGVEDIKRVWEKITGGEEFSFSFVDQALDAQYASEQNLGKIISISTLLAILLGSLGLYGLASISMQSRIKEISIRKVFGASLRSLLVLLTREYVAMVIIALIVSVPLTIYLMSQWLSTFEYHISMGAASFLIAGLISLIITLVTILYQTIITSNSRPAEMLRNE